jgi:predicted transcriptional regulator
MAGRKTKSDAPLMPTVPAAAVLSFLKDTRGLDSWTTQDLSKTLGISTAEAARAITFLELQGYVKAGHKPREFFTTAEGQTVSGSKLPHFSRERVEKALEELKQRVAIARKDFKATYKISAAVAFGDFLGNGSRVQAADVGVELAKRKSGSEEKVSATESKARATFLKQLRGKNTPLNMHLYEEWMGKRSHRKLA